MLSLLSDDDLTLDGAEWLPAGEQGGDHRRATRDRRGPATRLTDEHIAHLDVAQWLEVGDQQVVDARAAALVVDRRELQRVGARTGAGFPFTLTSKSSAVRSFTGVPSSPTT